MGQAFRSCEPEPPAPQLCKVSEFPAVGSLCGLRRVPGFQPCGGLHLLHAYGRMVAWLCSARVSLQARMNKWLPFKTLKGQLVSKSHPHLFRPGAAVGETIVETCVEVRYKSCQARESAAKFRAGQWQGNFSDAGNSEKKLLGAHLQRVSRSL